MWSQHRLPQQASFLVVVVVWGLAVLVRELGTLICKAEQLGCQGQAAQLAFYPSLTNWVGSQGRRGNSHGNPGACLLGPCELSNHRPALMATAGLVLSPGQPDEIYLL